jgi:hypothetical protein
MKKKDHSPNKTANAEEMGFVEKLVNQRVYTISMVVFSLLLLFAPIVSFLSPVDLPPFIILTSVVLSPALIVMAGVGIYYLFRNEK